MLSAILAAELPDCQTELAALADLSLAALLASLPSCNYCACIIIMKCSHFALNKYILLKDQANGHHSCLFLTDAYYTEQGIWGLT